MIDQERIRSRFTPTNLKNGLAYWKKDQFDMLENTSGRLMANVYGTDEYRAQLTIANDGEVDAVCTCPNNRTLFCKHVAVLYFEKFKDELALTKSKPRKSRATAKAEPTSKKEKQLLKLDNLDEVQLRNLVKGALDVEISFSAYVDNYFSADASSAVLYKNYKTKIQKMLTSGKRYGYIDYGQSNKIGREVINIAEDAQNLAEKGEFDKAFAICMAIIDKMIKPLNYTDTSSGLFYHGLDSALDLVMYIAGEENTPATVKAAILKYVMDRAKHEDLKGWDYEIVMVQIATKAAHNAKDRLRIEKMLATELNSDLYRADLQICLYDLVLKFDGDAAAKRYARQKILFPEFRRIVYDELMGNEAYDEAKAIMQAGLFENRDLRGIVFEWQRNLLHIAQLQEDTEEVKKIAETLFLSVGFDRDDYYSILKKAYGDDWPDKRKTLERSLTGRSHWLSELYFREKDAKALLNFLLREEEGFYIGGNLIDDRFVDFLVPEYQTEITEILKNKLHAYLAVHKDGKKYRRLCEQLIALKKKECDIKPLIAEIKESYPQRPSLMRSISEYFGL